jgi:hypothetical protein
VTDVVIPGAPFPNMHAAVAQNFEQFVHEIIVTSSYNVQRFLKQGHLLASRALRNNDNQPRVDVELGIFSQETFAIVVTMT